MGSSGGSSGRSSGRLSGGLSVLVIIIMIKLGHVLKICCLGQWMRRRMRSGIKGVLPINKEIYYSQAATFTGSQLSGPFTAQTANLVLATLLPG